MSTFASRFPARILASFLVAVPVGVVCHAAATLQVPKDHRTIQSAIDAASPGDLILVEPGTYRERIRLKPGLTVRSAGDDAPGKLGLARAEATLLDGGGKAGEGPGVAMAEGSSLDGFSITGVGLYDDTEWNRHHATHGEEQDHDRIGAPGTAGIAVDGVTCRIENNIVHHNGSTGIAVTGQEGRICSPRVARNVSYRNMGGGIGSMHGSTAHIEGNLCFENFHAGIGHSGASPLVISNVCHGNIRAGIGISEGAQPVVRGNRCYQNRRAGIGIRTGRETQPIVENNDCYENDYAGIGVREEAAPILRGNRCYRNQLAGIGAQTGAHPLILENECYENGQAGIGHEGDVVSTLIGNHSHHNQGAGIGFSTAHRASAVVLHNRLIENSAVALGLHGGWKVRAQGNELTRTGGMPPLVMVFEGAQLTLTDSVLRGGGVAALRVAGQVQAAHNIFEGTQRVPTGPPNFGVWALPGSKVILQDNEFRHWRKAVQADRAEVVTVRNSVTEEQKSASTPPPQ